MSKVHITLVGGQPAPVYLGIVHAQPDKVIFVCSNQTKDETTRIKNELTIPAETMVINPVALDDIEISILELAERVQGEEVTVNISGGTKPWTYFFTRIFSMETVKLFYVDQNNVIWDFTDKKPLLVQFDMDIQFRLYGTPLTIFRKFSEYTKEDFTVIKEIREIRKSKFYDFNKLTYDFSNKPNLFKRELSSGSKFEWSEEERQISFTLYNQYKKKKSIVFNSPHIRELLINTGWFEVEVAGLLSKWENAKELRLNCVFRSQKNKPKNEIDIIINTGVKLLFIECKTKICRTTEIDKFRSAVNNYGGMGSKALFVTDTPMSPKALEKCRDNNILPFSIQEYGDIKKCGEVLFEMLDKEIFKINKK